MYFSNYDQLNCMLTIHYFRLGQAVPFGEGNTNCMLFNVSSISIIYSCKKIKWLFDEQEALSAITVRLQWPISSKWGTREQNFLGIDWVVLHPISWLSYYYTQPKANKRDRYDYFSLNTVISVFIYAVYWPKLT